MQQLQGSALGSLSSPTRSCSRTPTYPLPTSSSLGVTSQPARANPHAGVDRARPLAAVLQREAPPTGYENGKHSQNGAGPATGRLLDRATAFEEDHKIRAYECGPDQRTTIFTISNLLQVCSGLQDGLVTQELPALSVVVSPCSCIRLSLAAILAVSLRRCSLPSTILKRCEAPFSRLPLT